MTNFGHKKPPRAMAAVISRQPSRAVRVQMLMNCPPEWQGLIRTYVNIAFERRKYAKD